MRRNAKYFEARTERLRRSIKVHEDVNLVLSSYSPGDGKRYQIQFVDKNSGEKMSLPSWAHLKTDPFDWYLTGLLDAIECLDKKIDDHVPSK
jgi:hypothetical protein